MLCRRKFWRMKIAGGPFCRMQKPRCRCPVLWIYSFWYPTRCWILLIMRRKRIFWKWKAHQHGISSLWFSYLDGFKWGEYQFLWVFKVLGALTLYLEAKFVVYESKQLHSSTKKKTGLSKNEEIHLKSLKYIKIAYSDGQKWWNCSSWRIATNSGWSSVDATT